MKLILCCKLMSNVNWQTLVDNIPCLLWGVIGLFASWLILKYVAKPLIQNCNDAKVRKEKYEREKFWRFYDKIELVSDEQLKKEIDGLKKEKSDIIKDNSEREAFLKKELEIYNTILNRLNIMKQADNKDNKQ